MRDRAAELSRIVRDGTDRAILQAAVEGYSVAEIAALLDYCMVNTIYKRIERMMARSGCCTRYQFFALVGQLGIEVEA